MSELQIGTAETYDVVVQPREDRAYAVMAESIDSSGFALATLAPRAGMVADVPPMRERPLLTMRDMGMNHGDHGGHGAQGGNEGHGDHGQHAGHGSHETPAADDPHAGHAGMASSAAAKTGGGMTHSDHASHGGGDYPHDHPTGPGVANVAMAPMSRLDEPGLGLEGVEGALTYASLRSLERNPDVRAPERHMELHLTSNMERYMWSFDGKKFSEVTEPLRFHHGERLRLTMVNDTMMSHPIHLHGMFFDLVVPGSEDDDHKVRKHTVIVKPAERLSIDITADAPGDWAFHCHLLYHMHAGMFRVVTVGEPPPGSVSESSPAHHGDHRDHSGHAGHTAHAGHDEHEGHGS